MLGFLCFYPLFLSYACANSSVGSWGNQESKENTLPGGPVVGGRGNDPVCSC